MGNKPTTLPPATERGVCGRKISHSTVGSNGYIQSGSNGCIQASSTGESREGLPARRKRLRGRKQKYSEEDFLVYGLDYLPDFEKRRVRRRRGSRKFLNLESFNWTTGYLQFLSRARASIRASADSAVFCTSASHVASSLESIPRVDHHHQAQHTELTDKKSVYKNQQQDRKNLPTKIPVGQGQPSVTCCAQERDSEDGCHDDETPHVCFVEGSTGVACNIFCDSPRTCRVNDIVNKSRTYQPNGFIAALSDNQGKIVNQTPTIEIETSDILAVPLLALSSSRDERTDSRLVFAGRFVPARDGGMECELSRNVEGAFHTADDILTRSVPDICLRPFLPKQRPSVCSATCDTRKDSTCCSQALNDGDVKVSSAGDLSTESNVSVKIPTGREACTNNSNTQELKNRGRKEQEEKNIKKKKCKKNQNVGCSVDESNAETVSAKDGIFLKRAATVDSGIDEVANGRASPSDSDWKNFSGYPYENVIMSGGGSKGYAYIGALKALEDCGVLRNVKRIAGSSAGAICAGLLAVGCTPQEIADVFKCDIKWLFHDQTCACCCCIPRVCHKYGIHPARRFHEIYGDHIARKVNDPDITFGQLQREYGRELCIVVTNLSRMCSEYCTPATAPDMPIRDAVRMSMAFPVVFRAVRYNLTGRECLYADGGILDQYPVHCFDDVAGGTTTEVNENKISYYSVDQSSLSSSTQQLEFNDKTIGLYVVSEKAMDYKIWKTLFGQEIPYKPTYLPNTRLARNRLKHELSVRKRLNKEFSKKEYMDELRATVGDAVEMFDHYEVLNKSHIDINNISEYFVAAVETLLISQRQLHVKPQDVNRTVAINCGYIGTNDYVIEPGDREFMLNQGYVCTKRFLSDFVKNITQRSTPTSATYLSPTTLDPYPTQRSTPTSATYLSPTTLDPYPTQRSTPTSATYLSPTTLDPYPTQNSQPPAPATSVIPLLEL